MGKSEKDLDLICRENRRKTSIMPTGKGLSAKGTKNEKAVEKQGVKIVGIFRELPGRHARFLHFQRVMNPFLEKSFS